MKTKTIIILNLFVYIAISVSFGQATEKLPLNQKVSFATIVKGRLTAPNAFELGEPIVLHFAIKNHSDKSIYIKKNLESGDLIMSISPMNKITEKITFDVARWCLEECSKTFSQPQERFPFLVPNNAIVEIPANGEKDNIVFQVIFHGKAATVDRIAYPQILPKNSPVAKMLSKSGKYEIQITYHNKDPRGSKGTLIAPAVSIEVLSKFRLRELEKGLKISRANAEKRAWTYLQKTYGYGDLAGDFKYYTKKVSALRLMIKGKDRYWHTSFVTNDPKMYAGVQRLELFIDANSGKIKVKVLWRVQEDLIRLPDPD